MNHKLLNKVISVLIALATVGATWVAFLQSDASNNDDRAGRDANRLALEALGKRVEGQARFNFDYDSAYQAWIELDTLALAAENRGDEASAERLLAVRDSMQALSPLMQAPYFSEAGEVDVARYEVDIYLREVTRLQEEFVAAAAVKDVWDSKANAYVVHLTMFAVALFLLGLSASLALGAPKFIFSSVGVVLASIAGLWAFSTYQEPVTDLRLVPSAISDYVEAEMLEYQGRSQEAIVAYDRAISSAPVYTNAYVGRAMALMSVGDYERALLDFQQAQALGATQAFVAGNYAYSLYLLGRYDEAIQANQVSVDAGNAELWQRFDIGLAHLSAGRFEQAQASYQAAMLNATEQVLTANQNGQSVSSELWWSLGDGASGLEDYLLALADPTSAEYARLVNPEQGRELALTLRRQVKSLATSLEYRGSAPTEALNAQISNLQFAEPLYDDEGNFSDYFISDEFDYGIGEVDMIFDYAQLRDGQDVLLKVLINGEEDPSWRILRTWEAGAQGEAYSLPLVIAYSDTFVLTAAYYQVELYIDGQLAAEGAFEVLPE